MKHKMGIVLFAAACAFGAAVHPDGHTPLPPPFLSSRMSVEEAIAARRSVREFKTDPIPLEQIGQLLWAAQGITCGQRGLRATPSAGATYPLELYLADPSGVYRYNPPTHSLSTVKTGDLRAGLARLSLNQPWVEQAPASLIIAAEPRRTAARYGRDRGLRYALIEAGHAAQNLHLQAVALGLGSVPVGAFRDEDIHTLLGLPDGQQVLYIIPVGYPRPPE